MSPLALVRETVHEFLDDDAPRMAAALSYYTVFSLPPLVIIVVTVAGLFMGDQQAQGQLVKQIGTFMGESGARAVASLIRNDRAPGGGSVLTTGLSIAGLLFGATTAFAQIQAALNEAWEVKKDPKRSGIVRFVVQRALSFGMILGVAVLLLASIALGTAISAAGGAASSVLPAGMGRVTAWGLDIAVSTAVITAGFMAVYKVLPDARVRWGDVWHGALAATILFVIGRFLISFYIGRSQPGGAYGAAGSLAILLLWVYYSSMIFLLGAEFTQVYARRRGHGIEPDEDAVRVRKTIEREEPGERGHEAGRNRGGDPEPARDS